MIASLRYAILRIDAKKSLLRLGFWHFLLHLSLFMSSFFLRLFSFFRKQQIKAQTLIIMDKLQSVPTVLASEDVNMVDLEGAGSNNQGDVFEGIVVQEVNSGKRGKGKLGCVSEEFEVFSRRVNIETIERKNVFVESPASLKQLGSKVEFLDPIPSLLANYPISARLRKAFELLSLCKAERDCKGFSGFSEETAENRVNFAESLVNAEILLELVRTKKEMQMTKDSLRAMGGELKNVKDTSPVAK